MADDSFRTYRQRKAVITDDESDHDDSDDQQSGSDDDSDNEYSNETSDNDTSDSDKSSDDDTPIVRKKPQKRLMIASDDSDDDIIQRSTDDSHDHIVQRSTDESNRSSASPSVEKTKNDSREYAGSQKSSVSDTDNDSDTSIKSDAFANSVVIPDTDDEIEEKEFLQNQFSPKTRRSITGRRSIAPRRSIVPPKALNEENESEDDDDDDDDDDDNDSFFSLNAKESNKSDESKSNSNNDDASMDEGSGIDRTPNGSDSFGVSPLKGASKRDRSIIPNDSIRTPASKRLSQHETTGLITSPISSSTPTHSNPNISSYSQHTDDSKTSGIHIQSVQSINVSSHKSGSIIELDSSDDNDKDKSYVPDTSSIRFNSISTSTPGPSKLIQPKINAMIKNVNANAKYVSKEFYDRELEKLNKAKSELKDMTDVYEQMKHALPDGGEKLLTKKLELEREIRKKEYSLNEMLIEEENLEKIQTVAATQNAVNDWRDGLNAIQPKHTGKTGLTTHNVQKALTLNRIEKLHKALEKCPTEAEFAEQPRHLKISLMDHQLHAIKWMRWREKQKPKGGLLADDMGLGKTLTVISLVLDTIYGEDEENQNETADQDDSEEDEDDDDDVNRVGNRRVHNQAGTLIVCPASLINQWDYEVQNRVRRDKLSVLLHHGNSRTSSVGKISKYDLVMTTYGVIASEQKSNGVLFRVRWERIVLDEAHMIRNHTTAMSKACCELRSGVRWGLTGTPIQNKAMDVYAMLKFLRVTPFDDLATFKKWINVNTAGGMSRLHNILKPMLLRRTKAELQLKGALEALPTKTINITGVDLSKDEANCYTRILTYSQALFAKYMIEHESRKQGIVNGPPAVISDELRKKLAVLNHRPRNEAVTSSTILVLLLRLRQICDHPGLIHKMLSDEYDMEEEYTEDAPDLDMNVMKAMIGLNINDSGNENNPNISNVSSDDEVKVTNIMSSSHKIYNFNNPSSKCKRVIELVNKILNNSDDKIVIVSQWTSVLDIVAAFLHREKVHYVELNGKTPIKSRNDIVVSFNKPNTSERVMMLSLVAGGVGLNLTGANHLILLDPHWNPQLESQAFDRVYRVGQKKPVQIYKLLCNKTVEQRIQEIQDAKLALSDNVLTGTKNKSGSKLSFQDMCRLFDM